jgi:uncharacterized protein
MRLPRESDFHSESKRPRIIRRMSEADNIAKARAFFDALSASGFRGARALLADDFEWWSAGAGNIQDQLEAMQGAAEREIAEPVRFKVLGVTAQGARVAVEVEGLGRLRNGKTYHNFYHFLLVVRDGKIAMVKEYHDTKHAHEVWSSVMNSAP